MILSHLLFEVRQFVSFFLINNGSLLLIALNLAIHVAGGKCVVLFGSQFVFFFSLFFIYEVEGISLKVTGCHVVF